MQLATLALVKLDVHVIVITQVRVVYNNLELSSKALVLVLLLLSYDTDSCT